MREILLSGIYSNSCFFKPSFLMVFDIINWASELVIRAKSFKVFWSLWIKLKSRFASIWKSNLKCLLKHFSSVNYLISEIQTSFILANIPAYLCKFNRLNISAIDISFILSLSEVSSSILQMTINGWSLYFKKWPWSFAIESLYSGTSEANSLASSCSPGQNLKNSLSHYKELALFRWTWKSHLPGLRRAGSSFSLWLVVINKILPS